MSDEKALLAAIRDNPDEDTPRLMYADWLDEHGQADRAEFIRLQIATARLPLPDPRRATAGQRSWDLLSRHARAWNAPFREVFGGIETRVPRRLPGDRGDNLAVTTPPTGSARPRLAMVIYRRGFPWLVEPVEIRSLRAENTRFPGPRPMVCLSTTQNDAGQVLTELGEVLTEDRFWGWQYSTNEFGYRALLDRPGLVPKLRRLGLHGIRVPAPELPDLLSRLGGNESLQFSRCDWGPELVEAVVASGAADRLTHFALTEIASLTIPDVLRVICRAAWPRLEELWLGPWHDPPPGAPQIAPAVPPGAFPRLREFHLVGGTLPEEELAAVLESPALARVPEVFYHGMGRGQDVFPELARKWAGRVYID